MQIRRYWWLLVAICTCPAALFAQETMSKTEVAAWSGVVKQIPEIFKALQSDEALPLLMVLCNSIVSLFKTKWFQSLVLKFSRRKTEIELTDAGKVTLALATAMAVTWAFSPAATAMRTIGKGLMLGFAAMGLFTVWKHTLRDVFLKDVPSKSANPDLPEVKPLEPGPEDEKDELEDGPEEEEDS